jgi:hypothetical protein
MGKMPGMTLAGLFLTGMMLTGCESCPLCHKAKSDSTPLASKPMTSTTTTASNTPGWNNQPASTVNPTAGQTLNPTGVTPASNNTGTGYGNQMRTSPYDPSGRNWDMNSQGNPPANSSPAVQPAAPPSNYPSAPAGGNTSYNPGQYNLAQPPASRTMQSSLQPADTSNRSWPVAQPAAARSDMSTYGRPAAPVSSTDSMIRSPMSNDAGAAPTPNFPATSAATDSSMNTRNYAPPPVPAVSNSSPIYKMPGPSTGVRQMPPSGSQAVDDQ